MDKNQMINDMKTKIVDPKAKFKPFSIEIEVESYEEAIELYQEFKSLILAETRKRIKLFLEGYGFDINESDFPVKNIKSNSGITYAVGEIRDNNFCGEFGPFNTLEDALLIQYPKSKHIYKFNTKGDYIKVYTWSNHDNKWIKNDLDNQ